MARSLSRFDRVVRSLVIVALAMLVVEAPASAHPPRFLTLPFPDVSGMHIRDGWWRGNHDRHAGIDYVRGRVSDARTWRTFPVVAAADGWACAARSGEHGCIDGVGTRVVVRSRVGGHVYYTYYGHLASVSRRIPLGVDRYTVHVRRGDLLGWAGHSGDPPGVIHLHFQVVVPPFRSLDPYGLYAYGPAYPDPAGGNRKGCGRDRLWVSCPPRPPGDQRVAPAGTPVDTPTVESTGLPQAGTLPDRVGPGGWAGGATVWALR